MPEGIGLAVVKGFAVPLAEEVRQEKSAFYLCFEQIGMIGGVLILILCVFLIGRLQKGFAFNKPVTSMLTLISGVFLIQLLFWDVSINSLPMYCLFLSLAITYKEEKEKVISNKIKFE